MAGASPVAVESLAHDPDGGSAAVQEPATNASARQLTADAARALSNTSLRPGRGSGNGGPPNDRGRSDRNAGGSTGGDLAASLEESLEAFVDPNRLRTGRVFETHRNVATKTQAPPKAPDVAEQLAQADRVLAWTAIRDAERTLSLAEDAEGVNDSGIERGRAFVRDATDAYSRGARQTGNGASPVARINAWQTAWQDAQSAMDVVDRDLDPNVTILRETDPVRSGNRSVTYPVAASTVVTRPGYTDATVVVDGDRQESVELTEMGETSFVANVTLDERVANVTVTVARTVPAHGEDGTGETTRVAESLLLDGDGLNESYETDTADTDPQDPDSDAGRTDADESDDGIVDGREDFDGDGLPSGPEAQVGTDPFEADTDGDSLDDGVEVEQRATSPTVVDTDGDGTGDAAEDPDGDGLSNGREADLGTRFTVADTDDDRLADGAEPAHDTNATDPDTDDDGLLDGVEVRNGFDPTVADTDGDGTPDAQETHTVTVTGENASVAVTGQGALRENTTVTRDRGDVVADRLDAVVSPTVEVESAADVASGEITIEYDESDVSDESRLAVYRFNETLGTFVQVDSTVDQANDTVTGTVDHFSRFAVLDVDLWKQKLGRQVPAGVDESDVLVFLRQGNNNAYGTLTLHNASIDESVDNVGGSDGVDSQGNGVPGVGATSHPSGCGDDEVHRLSDTEIDFNLETCGSDDAYFLSYNVLGPDPALEVEYRYTDVGVTIASEQYPTDATVPLAEDGVDVTDTDDDGIVDAIENQTIPLGNGLSTNTRYDDPDTDGDGLPDGAELQLQYKTSAGYQSVSDPADPDSDDDGLDDYEELRVWHTNPMDADTDDDGLRDLVDPDPLTETTLPAVEYETARSLLVYQDTLKVRASGTDGASDIDDIDVEKYVNPLPPGYSTTWQSATGHVESSSGEWYAMHFDYRDERLFTEARPTELEITVTDDLGSEVVIEHDVEDNDAVVKAGLAAGGGAVVSTSPAASFGPPGWAAIGGVAVGAAILGTAVELSAESVEGQQAAETVSFSVPSTATEATWTTSEGVEFTLPAGTVAASEVRNGQEYNRGFGWEYIAATTEIAKADLRHAVQNGRVVRDGELTYIIGQGAAQEEKIILAAIEGTLLAAASARSVEDGTEECREVHYTNEQVQEHSSREDKIVDWTDILTAIEDPAAVGSGDDLLYYIRKVGDEGYVIVKVWKDIPSQVLFRFGQHIDNWFGTTLVDPDSKSLFDSLEDAKDRAEQNAESNDDEVNNWNDDPEGC